MLRRSILVVLFLAPAVSGPAAETPQTPVQKMLARPIVGPVLPLAEVQRFCEARLPPMPKMQSAAAWEAEAQRIRAAVIERVVYRGEAARWRDAPAKVEWLDTIAGGPGYRIRKLRYEALPGLWIPALLYEPEKLSGRVAAVLNVNGHVGAPGKAYIPKQLRSINHAKRGMLALNVEWVGMGQLGTEGFSHARMNQLDLCGTSGLAVFYLNMKRGLDVLLDHPNCDPQRVAVTGLSGGGWQTIFLSSLDTRVKLANPVAGYSGFRTRIQHLEDLGDSEQTPNDLATVADYTHLTAMMAPRPTLLTKNAKDDCCFASGHSLQPLLDAARPAFKLYGKEGNLRWHVNEKPGTHNYEVDNRQAFYRIVGDCFFAGDKSFVRTEIDSEKEVKKPEELNVPLPARNEDFHTLALALAKNLPRGKPAPSEKAALAAWQAEQRALLRRVVKAAEYHVRALPPERVEQDGLKAAYWRLLMNDAWTVPVVELVRGEPKKTAVLVADGGRASAEAEAARLMADGCRVLVVDPFCIGESRPEKDWLFALLVAAEGERPLGIQASQVAAVARWSAEVQKTSPVTVVAVGPRAGLIALVAAALEEKAIAAAELHGCYKSLKEVIERNGSVDKQPEMFCFGLLESFDISTLAALASPREVKFLEK